jgi:hypothetical protein
MTVMSAGKDEGLPFEKIDMGLRQGSLLDLWRF